MEAPKITYEIELYTDEAIKELDKLKAKLNQQTDKLKELRELGVLEIELKIYYEVVQKLTWWQRIKNLFK
jgi:hypothetical protein